MKIDKYEFPDELYYDKEHNWARVEGDTATVGLTDLGQALAHEVLYVETPRTGRNIEQTAPFMSLESGKWVGRVKAVLSGEIVAANEELEFEANLVNEQPYGEGWFVQIKLSDPAEVDGLLRASDADYAEFINVEREKYNI